MILIISNDQKFIKFCLDAVTSAGYVYITSNYENAVELAINSKADAAVVHSDKVSEASAKECVSTLALRTPELKILTAVEKLPHAPSLYLDIEGSHRQLNLPCSPEDLISALTRFVSSSISVKVLELRNGRKDVILLGEKMTFSKTDYTILRLTAKAYPDSLDVNSLRSLFQRMTENCLAVHINTINKAAERIIERRLIVFKNGYKLNKFM